VASARAWEDLYDEWRTGIVKDRQEERYWKLFIPCRLARHEIQIDAFIETTRTRPRSTLLTWGTTWP